MVMFDSLNRHMLPSYGSSDIQAPNFKRLQNKTLTFDQSWVGSMPCMPARRDLHTGRYNFLHRGWGPLEPYDDSMPEILKEHGIYTHLVTDHQHYWEDGGYNYHTKYNSFEFSRGQEGDPWKGDVNRNSLPNMIGGNGMDELNKQDWVNRRYIKNEEEYPQAKTFEKGIEFIDTNANENEWFLQIETFDPHEPFFAPEKYQKLYENDYEGPHFDWPNYEMIEENEEQVHHVRQNYKALITMCDVYLGKLLDKMDEYNLWEDTLLIVNTDHGFLLGEHDWWGKCVQPFYNEVARTPFFIHHPYLKEKAGEHVQELVQMIDVAPTLLDFFNVSVPSSMEGHSLLNILQEKNYEKKAALFGIHGGHVNCTNGKYVYMRAPVSVENKPLYNYTLMPVRLRGFFSEEELQTAALVSPFSFTKKTKVIQTEAVPFYHVDFQRYQTMLFDIEKDPHQLHPINDSTIEDMMVTHMKELMKKNDAPSEQYSRLGLNN